MAKYDVEVQLNDGNALAVMGAVLKALKAYGAPQSELSKFQEEAMAGNYNHLLRTTSKWVRVWK